MSGENNGKITSGKTSGEKNGKRVVITGTGAVTPVGNNTADFFKSLIAGKSGIGFITKFDAADFKVKICAEVKDFSPSDRIPPNELRRLDLYSQYALYAAHEAVEDSKIIGGVAPERLGVYVGSGIGGINTMLTEHSKLLEQGPRRVSPFLVPMMIGNIAAGSIAIKFGAKGVSLPVVTACSTSTNAIGEAYRAIKHGYADAIICGGSEGAINKLSVAGFTSCMALSQNEDPKTACRPFDKDRDGFIIGEGAGILVLEEYENARSRGAKIYAEIIAYGNTNDAYHITAPEPNGEGATACIRLAAAEAGLTSAEDIYINAHGTSTKLNDKTETIAIKNVFAKSAYKAFVSSTKSMTGHMLGGTGAAEAIASVMALRSGILPPTVNYNTPDAECDLNYIPNKAIKKKLNTAMSLSFGFGGHNACIVLRTI
jgi:3-oxoacyl-[acyl-carrier-protein] synthase II